jgi:hypothetical protein
MCLRNVIVRAGRNQNRQKRVTASNQSAVKSEPTHFRHPHVCDQAGADVQARGVKKNSSADKKASALNPNAHGNPVAARVDASLPTIAIEGLIGIAALHSTATRFSTGPKIDGLGETRPADKKSELGYIE